VIGESSHVTISDCLVLCSDGVTQAGMGRGFTFVSARRHPDFINGAHEGRRL
jgi:serine phosphatase RsbU (regulator of sigma subunit)